MVRDINWVIKDFERLFNQSVRLEAEDDFSQGFNAGWAEARKAMYALTREVECECGEVPAETDIDVLSEFQELDRLVHSMEEWETLLKTLVGKELEIERQLNSIHQTIEDAESGFVKAKRELTRHQLKRIGS